MGGIARRPRPGIVEARDVLDALGCSGARPLVEALCARGEAALVDLLEAMASPDPDRDRSPRTDFHPADWDADMTDLIVRLTRAHPQAFVDTVGRLPALLELSAVLAGAGQVASAEADAWLLEALTSSSGFRRRQALDLLLKRGNEQVRPRLRKLLRDRDPSVRSTACDGLRRFGGPDDLEEILRYGARAGLGGLESAFDAVESICRRAGIPLPPEHPGARLVELDLGQGASLARGLIRAMRVRAGDLLATAGDREVRAPHAGDVAAIDPGPDGRPRRIVLRAVEP